jgi:hypothetical protein
VTASAPGDFGDGAGGEEAEIFARQSPISWEAKGKSRLYFPGEELEEDYKNRIARHRRMYRDGARLDDTGSNERVWVIRSFFHNENEDPAVQQQGKPLYPNVADELCESFRVHETGTLILPSTGPVRARAESYKRNGCAFILLFVEDNEDDAGAAQFSKPSIGTVGPQQVEALMTELDGAGWGGGDIADIFEEVAGTLSLYPAPEIVIADEFVSTTERLIDACEDVAATFEDRYTNPSGNLETRENSFQQPGPEQHRLMRRLSRLVDTAHASIANVRVKLGSRRVVTFPNTVSFFDVAVETGTPFPELVKANPGLNPFEIPPNTPVIVIQN